jgi:SAM-dependent methyltransferase
MTAAEQWRRDLAAWAIPDEILERAPESPWIHPPELFDLPDRIVSSPSHERAREALGADSSVLDIGCGGGIATFALVPDVKIGVGVDQQEPMLAMYERNAAKFGVSVVGVLGNWPDVADNAPVCDVAAAHHVVYNVAEIVPFLRALNEHARNRVVLEMPTTHPLSSMSEAWRHFWALDRPTAPTPRELVSVIEEIGYQPRLEVWNGPMRTEVNLDQAARFMRIRLCLPEDREGEVREFLLSHEAPQQRSLATVWWDVAN